MMGAMENPLAAAFGLHFWQHRLCKRHRVDCVYGWIGVGRAGAGAFGRSFAEACPLVCGAGVFGGRHGLVHAPVLHGLAVHVCMDLSAFIIVSAGVDAATICLCSFAFADSNVLHGRNASLIDGWAGA